MGATHEPHGHTRHVLARCLEQEITVTDFRCRACRHPLSADECNVDPSIVFVRRGVFVRSQEGESIVADASRVLFFNPQQPYRISHPIAGGDDCTILTISPTLALEVVARHAPRAAEKSSCLPFPLSHAPAALNAWRMHYEILASVRTGTDLVLEELLLSVIHRIVGASHGNDSGNRRRGISRQGRQRTARRHRELANAAVVAINRDLARPPSLRELAGGLGCSPYHLSRVFREMMGESLRAYLATARARAAADALARGARNLTELALQLGYVDHSHFTNAFHKEWQVSPSAFRSLMKGEGSFGMRAG
jgi:AraC-like DNA-binding protein